MSKETKEFKESKLSAYFDENVVNDIDILMTIGDAANDNIQHKLKIYLGDYKGSSNYKKAPIAVYIAIFKGLLKVLKDKQKDFECFCINVCNRFLIEFNNNSDDEESEKVATFAPFMKYIEPPIEKSENKGNNTYEKTTTESECVNWLLQNMTEQQNTLDEVAIEGRKNLNTLLDINTKDNIFIMPLFCIIHENIISEIKLLFSRLGSEEPVEIDIAGIYYIQMQIGDDGVPAITYMMGPAVKELIKDDNKQDSNEENYL